MRAVWRIDAAAAQRWGVFVEANGGRQLVRERKRRNVDRVGIVLSKARVWHVLVGCQVTTQQRSGPGSLVDRFMRSGSPALSFQECVALKLPNSMLKSELRRAGLGKWKKIADNLVTILRGLEGGEWSRLMSQLKSLRRSPSLESELSAAEYLRAGNYPGLGPKQSRNFLQWLGVSREVIPVDSRVLARLEEMGCDFVPKATALSDERVYSYVERGLQQLAAKLEIWPCVLDACIFASVDGEE